MVAQKGELSALRTTEKLSKTPAIKGKIAIVRNSDGDITIDRFAEDGSTFDTDPTIPGETYNNFLPVALYAKTPDEIDTLIKIDCVTNKKEALYSDLKSSKEELKFYEYILCDIGIVDYKTATLTARKQVGKSDPPRMIDSRTVARHPWLEIVEYLKLASSGAKTK